MVEVQCIKLVSIGVHMSHVHVKDLRNACNWCAYVTDLQLVHTHVTDLQPPEGAKGKLGSRTRNYRWKCEDTFLKYNCVLILPPMQF